MRDEREVQAAWKAVSQGKATVTQIEIVNKEIRDALGKLKTVQKVSNR